jgi:hypothetical protein
VSVDIATIITDYDWSDTSRPILTIADDRKSAVLQIGAKEYAPIFEISASSVEDLRNQFEGFVEIFQKAVEFTST